MADASEGESESTWTRLTRRKVAQWGVAYAAGAWGFLQGLQYVSDAFGWPAQLRQVAILALLVGLPIVLVIAWYHGDKGEQRVGRTELAILTVLFLLGGSLFWRYEHSTTKLPAAAPASAVTSADARPSIAVLPFENRSDEHKDAFFVDGIHDDILTQISKVSALKVISRTSVERFRDTKLPMREIAQQLGVTKILEGGVQRAGDRVRITVQLIDANTDGHLWAESYDRELTAANIFAIQSEVAAAIAAALNTALSSAEKSRASTIPTKSLAAWEAYQLGRQRMANRTSKGLAEAEVFFQRSIALDPKFALAYVGLADAIAIRPERSKTPRAVTLDRAERAVGTALRLDRNLAEAWATSGMIAQNRGQGDRAETMYRRAIELNPNYATAYQWYSGVLTAQGRLEEAHRNLERAVELDPLSAIINLNLGNLSEQMGRPAEAGVRYRKVIEIDPSMSLAYFSIGHLEAYTLDRVASAVRFTEKAIELDPGNPELPIRLAFLYFNLGDDDQATRVAADARLRFPDSPPVLWWAAVAATWRGDARAAREDADKLLLLDPRDADVLKLLRDLDAQADNYAAARRRYAKAYPELLATVPTKIDGNNWPIAVDLALVLQKTGEGARASVLLNGAEARIRSLPRMGMFGYGITDVEIDALRGQKREAIASLREAVRAGWRGPGWRDYRDLDHGLASIRNEPEFKAVFADIERDMARQRAELAARPKDAPLDLAAAR